jgi:hypothetical protein
MEGTNKFQPGKFGNPYFIREVRHNGNDNMGALLLMKEFDQRGGIKK